MRPVAAVVRMRAAEGLRSPWLWGAGVVLALLTAHDLTITGVEASGLIQIGETGHDVRLTIAWLGAVLCFLLIPLIGLTTGRFLAEDREGRFLPLLLSTPLSTRGYLVALWASGVFLSWIASAGLVAGCAVSWTVLPAEFLHGGGVAAIVSAGSWILLPNILVATLLVLAASRRHGPSGALCVALLLAAVGIIASGLVSDWARHGVHAGPLLESAILIEPTGTAALARWRVLASPQLWDLSSPGQVPLLAINRALWLTIAGAVSWLALFRGPSPLQTIRSQRPRRRAVAMLLRAGPYLIVPAAALLAVAQISGNFSGNLRARGLLPTTSMLLREGLPGFAAPAVLATFLLVGHLLWRHRETGFSVLRDATARPVLGHAFRAAAAVGAAQFAFLALVGLAVFLQSAKPAWPMDWNALAWVLLRHGAALALVAALAFVGACIGSRRVTGAAVSLLTLAAGVALAGLAGGGSAWLPYAVGRPRYAGIWLGLQERRHGVLLLLEALGLALGFFSVAAWRWRWGPQPRQRPRSRRERSLLLGSGALGCSLAVACGLISAPRAPAGARDRDVVRAAYEQSYGDEAPPPVRILAVAGRVDLLAADRVTVEARYAVENDGTRPIHTLPVSLLPLPDSRVTILVRGRPAAAPLFQRGFAGLELDPPLPPAGRIDVVFRVETERAPALAAAGWREPPAGHGAWLTSFLGDLTVFPQVGYRREVELAGSEVRSRLGLSPQRGWLPESSAAALSRVTRDRVQLRLEVLAPDGLEVIASGGPARSEKIPDGRRMLFQPEEALRFEICVLAGYMETGTAEMGGMTVAVHGPPGSSRQVGRVLQAARRAVASVTELMGESPAHHLDIVAMPADAMAGSSALSKPGMIFLDEAGPFASALPSDGALDPLVGTLSHELMHQWFGHRVRPPAWVEGALFVNEFPAQFARLWTIRQCWGPQALETFLAEESARHRHVEVVAGEDRRSLVAEDSPDRIYTRSSLAIAALVQRAGWGPLASALRDARDRAADRPLPGSELAAAIAGVMPDESPDWALHLLTADPERTPNGSRG
jgi:hypothetical protein